MDIEAIKKEMYEAAFVAADTYFKKVLGGVDRYACGFAWITVYPEHKGNTKAGKEERKVLESLGFSKDYTGKAYEIWNPSKYACQNVDTLEQGARGAAMALSKYGIKAYVGSRLD
jgi:DNA-directed RNA polymerase subunit N (RpoN/RPB10)